MRPQFPQHQVFLNYPFDEEAQTVSSALHFAVVAAGLLPICALDVTSPDRPRLEVLVETITSCQYSAHDFSRCTADGKLGRFNMPIEMGMALFHALHNQKAGHRCAFFVTELGDYRHFVSDLAGLDPLTYDTESALLARMYEWLRDGVGAAFIPKPSAHVSDMYAEYRQMLMRVRGSGKGGKATHHEAQELMYQIASKHGLWDWRANRAGQRAFPEVPLSWLD